MPSRKSLQIKQIELKQFRCFSQQTISLDAPLVLIEGPNGVGKTSLLEALYYACYLRSFRTHLPREIAHFADSYFYIKVDFNQREREQQVGHEIQVGFTHGNRRVKVNQKNISGYKQLMDHYRVVGLTEHDIEMITGSPAVRRLFLDHVLMLTHTEYLDIIRAYRSVVSNRNALLQHHKPSFGMYEILSEQLIALSEKIREYRTQVVKKFGAAITQLMETQFTPIPWRILLSYTSKGVSEGQRDNFEGLFEKERRMRRSLIGAHLDDLVIQIKDRSSRRFASRGEQKLITLLLKIVQLQDLIAQRGSAVFLLDDFMTDFDEGRSRILLDILQELDVQLIFTSPSKGFLYNELKKRGALISLLTH